MMSKKEKQRNLRRKKRKLHSKRNECNKSLIDKFFSRTGIGTDKNAYYELLKENKYKSILDRVNNRIYEDQDKEVRDRAMDYLTRSLVAQE